MAPRYLRIEDVPALLAELKEITVWEKQPPYQLNAWQQKWCHFAEGPEQVRGGGDLVDGHMPAGPTAQRCPCNAALSQPCSSQHAAMLQDAAVLSYRWRVRGRAETAKAFKEWVADCGSVGYTAAKLTGGRDVDWDLANGHQIQTEVRVSCLGLWNHSDRSVRNCGLQAGERGTDPIATVSKADVSPSIIKEYM
jgi:hypothetical protein